MNKRSIIIGVVSLIITAIIQAIFTYGYKKDWITLLSLILYGCLFLKYWYDDYSLLLKIRVSKKWLMRIGVLIMFLGLSLLPRSFGKYLSDVVEFLGYIVSFISLMMGSIFIQIASEKK